MVICVFGSSSERIDREYLDTAENLAKSIAKKGHSVVFGAGKYGVMGATARGVTAENGTLIGVSPEFFNNFIILSMAGYFTAIVRAPITGIILITEMTGSFTHLLSLTIVSIIAYIVADMLKSPPIYDSLLENLLQKNNIHEYHSHSTKKTLITNVVHFGSKIENSTLSSIKLPENTLIVSIKRGEESIVPKGNTIIRAGDTLITITDLKLEWKVREFIDSITTIE